MPDFFEEADVLIKSLEGKRVRFVEVTVAATGRVVQTALPGQWVDEKSRTILTVEGVVVGWEIRQGGYEAGVFVSIAGYGQVEARKCEVIDA